MRFIRKEYPPVTGVIMLIVNIIFGFIELVVGLRILLELLGANQGSYFVQWIYGVSYPFVLPFVGVFPNRTISDGFFLDAAAILAFIIYGLIWAFINGVVYRYSYIEE